ncbi:MAG: winged helix-turn-helix domain-containing protein [Woeseiaceae bacterium]|nr:winged helix-turn-helix domain-containing protein [Woeseiaceae bacterium]
MVNTDLKQGFYLGEWEVRPLQLVVVGPDGKEHVEKRWMEVLVLLATRAGEVIERDEILDIVWEGRAMNDEPLNRCISQLRKVLGDSPQQPRFIATITKVGYQLIAPVRPLEPAAPEVAAADGATEKAAPRRASTLRVLSLAAVALVAVGAMIIWMGGFPQPDEASIVVLPFDNLGDDSTQDDLGRGLAEEIRQRLAGVDGLTVAGRTSSRAAFLSDKDAPTIADDLGVSYLLEGSIRVDGDDIRIATALLQASGYEVWSETYEMRLLDVFQMQDQIANDIAGQVVPGIVANEAGSLISTAQSTRNPQAYLLFVRGQEQLASRSEGPLRRSITLFEEAIELDRRYADAYVGLATAHALLPFYSDEPMAASFDRARSIIATGAQADSSVDTRAAGIVAFMLFHSEWRWIESENAFRVALQNAPDDAELLNWYSLFQASVGRADRSLDYAARARDLEPLSPVVNQRLAVAHLWVDQNELAAQQFAVAAEQGMPVTTQPEAYLVLLLRRDELEIARLLMAGQQKLAGLDAAWVDALFMAMQDPSHKPAAVDAVERAVASGDISDLHLFGVWVYLEETERAIDTALRLTENRIRFIPEFLFAVETAELRRHPRFAEVVRAVGLDRYWDYFGWPDLCRREGDTIACS